MLLTRDPRFDDGSITLEETPTPFADRDQNGFGISEFTGLSMPSGTGDHSQTIYWKAAVVYPGSFPLALIESPMGALEEFLRRDWAAQLVHA